MARLYNSSTSSNVALKNNAKDVVFAQIELRRIRIDLQKRLLGLRTRLSPVVLKYLFFIVAITSLQVALQAGCGHYRYQGTNIAIITPADIAGDEYFHSSVIEQYIQYHLGISGEEEPMCNGPNCGKRQKSTSNQPLPQSVVRLHFLSACTSPLFAITFLDGNENRIDVSAAHDLDGYLSEVERPPRS